MEKACVVLSLFGCLSGIVRGQWLEALWAFSAAVWCGVAVVRSEK